MRQFVMKMFALYKRLANKGDMVEALMMPIAVVTDGKNDGYQLRSVWVFRAVQMEVMKDFISKNGQLARHALAKTGEHTAGDGSAIS